MKQIFNPCEHYRKQISLLVSEAPPEAERAGVEDHLSTCAECRQYRDEVAVVTESLLGWEENFASVRPNDEMLARWDKNFANAFKPDCFVSNAFALRVFAWCKDVVWPSRRIWAGLAAVWVVIFATNFSERSPIGNSVAKSAAPSPELVRAFFEGEGSFDQPVHPAEKKLERVPAPRSEAPSGSSSSKSI